MRWIALVVVVAACGGSSSVQPAPPREPVKPAIAPPPSAPPVEEKAAETPAWPEGSGNATAAPDENAKASLDAKLWPATELAVTEPTGAPAKSKLAGNVLVWIDAKLYVAPKDTAKSIQLANLDARKDRAGHAIPMHVVGTKGDFVEIESPARDAGLNSVMDCAWFGLETPMDMEHWRLFVKRADLAPVIAKKHSASFADGSKLELRPGVPVIPLADGRWLVDLRQAWVPVTLPADVVGYAYPPLSTERKEATFERRFQLHARTFDLADARVKLRGMFNLLAEQIEQKGDRVAFPFDSACATASVIVDAASVRPYESKANGSGGGGMGSIGLGTAGAERWYLPVGTTLVAEGGTASVKVRYPLTVTKPAKTDKTVCVDRGPFVASRYVFAPTLERFDISTRALKMCAPVRAVKHDKGGGFGVGKGFGLGTGKRR
jgi:hypothetical protein